MAALQEKAERQALQVSRRLELEEWLGQQPMMFTEYDDGGICTLLFDKTGWEIILKCLRRLEIKGLVWAHFVVK